MMRDIPHRNQAVSRAVRAEDIPVIDITPLRDGSDPAPVARALHDASRHLGFIYIRGHGIEQAVIDAARASAYAFFRASPADKARVTISPRHRGWLGPGAARMHDDAPVDLKESFLFGDQDANGHTLEDHPLRGRNHWPDFVPGMATHAMAYFHAASAVARHLLGGFAQGLGLAPDFFLRHLARPLSRASYVYYPHQHEDPGQGHFGVAPHTDFGVLTVLHQDDVGGLEVQDVHGDWLSAPPIDGTLLVNVGDLLARWTDGVYPSTPHRVINRSGRERLSLVLAFDPDPETPVDARAVFGDDHQAQSEPITCGDYLVQRFARAFAYRERT